MKNYKIIFCGVFVALAMIFSYIEAIIPIPVGIPGIKPGIANVAIIVIIYKIGNREALIINAIRIVLTSILFGNMIGFLFSITAGIISTAVMILLKKTDMFSMAGVSISGGVTHNIVQIIVAIFVMGSSAIAYYLPVLIITGVISGIIVGFIGAMVTKRLKGVHINE